MVHVLLYIIQILTTTLLNENIVKFKSLLFLKIIIQSQLQANIHNLVSQFIIEVLMFLMGSESEMKTDEVQPQKYD